MSEHIDVHIRHMIHAASGAVEMDVHINIEKSSVFAITGPSGSGKTTLLKHIAGLIKPDWGVIQFGNNIWLDSRNQVNVPVQKRKIGFVFQDYALFPNLTVRQNLAYALQDGANEKLLDELLTMAELSALQNRRPNQLSGGQQQRVAIIRAIASRPQLLLLDEPMSALDIGFRTKVQDLLMDFHRRFRFTMVIVTHQISDIFQLADRVAVIDEGKVAVVGTPSEVFLPSNQKIDETVLYAEVLSIDILTEYLSVVILLQHRVMKVNINKVRQKDIKVGDRIAIPLNTSASDFNVIEPYENLSNRDVNR